MNIEDRLNKLERESKNWRRIALGLALVIGVSLSCSRGPQVPTASRAFADGTETFDTLRARRLDIVGPSGEVVAEFFGHDMGADLVIRHLDAGTQKLSAQTTIRGFSTIFESFEGVEKGKPGVGVMAIGIDKKENGGTILLWNPVTERQVVNISFRKEANAGHVNLFNPHGKCVVSMQSSKTNEGLIIVSDVNGNAMRVFSGSSP